jgi:hypothetical integral membrane protein (TIGR02206 family)
MDPFSWTEGNPLVLFRGAHLVSLAISFSVVIGLPIFLRRVLLTEESKRKFRVGLALAMLAQHSTYFIWLAALGVFDFRIHLPLHICALTSILSAISLISGSKRLPHLIVFWAIGGALQALVTPDAPFGWPHFRYIQTNVHHGLIVFSGAYYLVVERVRPTIKTLLWAALITNLYLGAIMAFNALSGSNYLYVNGPPPFPTMVDFLIGIFGPWPRYLLGLELIGWLSFGLVWLPFGALTLFKGSRAGEVRGKGEDGP